MAVSSSLSWRRQEAGLLERLVWSKVSLRLIDWESAALGEPALDLAWMQIHGCLNPDKDDDFWRAYGQEEGGTRERTAALRPLVRFRWWMETLWFAVQVLEGRAGIGIEPGPYARGELAWLQRDILDNFEELRDALGDIPSPPHCFPCAGRSLLGLQPLLPASRVVCVEGPSSSLKSELASQLAVLIGGQHLSAGILFRAFGLEEAEEKEKVVYHPLPHYPYAQVWYEAKELTGLLFTPEMENSGFGWASRVEVWGWVASGLRRSADPSVPWVVDGRFVAEQLFPEQSIARVVVDAPLEFRAERKRAQFALDSSNEVPEVTSIEVDLARRDARDQSHHQGKRVPIPTLKVDSSTEALPDILGTIMNWLIQLPVSAEAAQAQPER